MAEAKTFSDRVEEAAFEERKKLKRDAELRLAPILAEFRENRDVAERLGIKEELEKAIQAIQANLGFEAKLNTSEEPKIESADKIPFKIVGEKRYFLSLSWRRSINDQWHHLQLSLDNGEITLNPFGKDVKRFKFDEVTKQELDQEMFDAMPLNFASA